MAAEENNIVKISTFFLSWIMIKHSKVWNRILMNDCFLAEGREPDDDIIEDSNDDDVLRIIPILREQRKYNWRLELWDLTLCNHVSDVHGGDGVHVSGPAAVDAGGRGVSVSGVGSEHVGLRASWWWHGLLAASQGWPDGWCALGWWSWSWGGHCGQSPLVRSMEWWQWHWVLLVTRWGDIVAGPPTVQAGHAHPAPCVTSCRWAQLTRGVSPDLGLATDRQLLEAGHGVSLMSPVSSLAATIATGAVVTACCHHHHLTLHTVEWHVVTLHHRGPVVPHLTVHSTDPMLAMLTTWAPRYLRWWHLLRSQLQLVGTLQSNLPHHCAMLPTTMETLLLISETLSLL